METQTGEARASSHTRSSAHAIRILVLRFLPDDDQHHVRRRPSMPDAHREEREPRAPRLRFLPAGDQHHLHIEERERRAFASSPPATSTMSVVAPLSLVD
ncbi:hypothetical protein D1007_21126 [Hordeum vulgare]|nr:hypothetical protein D1007_21126 [Hordeum vulgare]